MTLLRPTAIASPRPCPIALLGAAVVSNASRRMARGELVLVYRGIYADAEAWRGLKPWERYLARVYAVLQIHPSVVLCLESAAALWGLPVFGDPVIVHVLGNDCATSRLTGGIRVHTTRDHADVVELNGVLVTSRKATAVDLARSRHHAISLAVADAALRADSSLTVDDLVSYNESRITSRGRRHARWPLHASSPLPESPLESVSRALVGWLGFEEPELQVRFTSEGVEDRVDFWWRRARVIGEADGDVKYDGTLGDPVAALRTRETRDRRLRRSADAIAHWGWRDTAQVSPVRESLMQAGLRPLELEASAQLHSLRALLLPKTALARETAAARRNSTR